MKRLFAVTLVLILAACSETPTALEDTSPPELSAPSFSLIAPTPTDVTYGMLHGTVRFSNAAVVSVSAGTFTGNTATVPPGSSVRVKGNWQIGPVTNTSYCPGCIIQIYLAWIPAAAANGATPYNKGLWSGQTYSPNPNPGASGAFDWTTTAPTVPGVYHIGRGQSLDYQYNWWVQGGTGWPTAGPTSPADAASFMITVPDPTAPEVAATVTGTLGDGGWYISDVDVSWTVADPESGIDSSSGCDAVTVDSDTNGITFTCTADSFGGTTTESVTIMRDATAPEVSFSGNAGSYDVSDDVAITCSATDATSGIATDDCADISGPAWGFSLGTTTFSATAMDNAGHSDSASGSFEVSVSFAGVCAMVTGFVENRGVANSMCAKLRGAEKAKNANTRDNHLNAFMNEVAAQTGKKLTAAQAAALMALATALQS